MACPDGYYVRWIDGHPQCVPGGGSTPADTVALECPPTVTRGDSLTCTARGLAALHNWIFTPDDTTALAKVIRPEGESADSTWGGRVVASGTVSVAGTPRTPAGTTSTVRVSEHVVVNARDWTGQRATYIPPTGPESADSTDLPDHPHETPNHPGEELGHFHENAYTQVDTITAPAIRTGPNAQYYYVAAAPMLVKWRIHVNYKALKVGSDFYSRQLQRRPTYSSENYCAREDVTPFRTLAEKHEGVGLDPHSHAYAFQTTLDKYLGPQTEALTASSRTALAARVRATVTAAHVGAFTRADSASAAVDALYPINYRCNFNYYPQENQ